MVDWSRIDFIGFDLNGTLVENPSPYIKDIVGRTMGLLGVNGLSELELLSLWYAWTKEGEAILQRHGLSNMDFWTRLNTIDTDETRRRTSRAYEDVSELERLHKAGKKLVIITSGKPDKVEVETELLPDVFLEVLCANHFTGLPTKPNPTAMYMMLEKYGVSPRRSCYVGNGPEDVEFAKNAGCASVLIRDEYKVEGISPDLKVNGLKPLVDEILK